MLKQLLIALDQTLNCCVRLSDGWGRADEMLSARAYRLRKEHPWLMRWIDRFFFWDDYHCQECYGIEMARLQLPAEYQTGRVGNGI